MATIQISEKLGKALSNRKIFDDESYEDVIWGLLEHHMELSKETKRNIANYEKNEEKWMKEGKFKSLDQIIKERKM